MHTKSSRPPAVLVLAGPTAVGKTAVALELANRWNAEIVSADSRQIYRHLNVGTAKPTKRQQQRVAHHLIDICDPSQRYSAAQFAADAESAITDITARGRKAIVVGGTGLYLKALIEGMFQAAETSPETRNQVDQIAASGKDGLVEYLEAHDPLTWNDIDRQNPARLRRAVEYHVQNQESLAADRDKRAGKPAPFRFYCTVLVRNRPQLYEHIEHRVNAMLQGGWIKEVEELSKRFDFSLPAFNAVGYRDLQQVVLHRLMLEEARSGIIRQTRRYAKRQLTWFSHQGQWTWMTPDIEITSKIASGFEDFSENKNA